MFVFRSVERETIRSAAPNLCFCIFTDPISERVKLSQAKPGIFKKIYYVIVCFSHITRIPSPHVAFTQDLLFGGLDSFKNRQVVSSKLLNAKDSQLF